MPLEITKYGHPALRSKGRAVKEIDDRTRKLAADMIDTMVAAEGVGLAAQQVGLPVQLCVIDVSGAERPGTLRVGGAEVDLDDYMPLVLVNPEVFPEGAEAPYVEGCLSFPGILAEIKRPEAVRVRATTLDGGTLEFEADGLLARAVQHEHDHLHGILFIDRMTPEARHELAPELNRLMAKYGG